MKDTFFVSSAVDYPSSRPHAGHLYEKIICDVLSRWNQLKGKKVHFSTGLDCHGSKIARYAKEAKKTPEQFVKEMEKFFIQLCKDYNISYTDFIETMEPRHKKIVIKMINDLYKQGDIYKGKYSGYYCSDCETYYSKNELVNELNCPTHNKLTEFLEEDSYFFKMSKYKDKLIEHIKKNPNYILPEKKRNEILNRLNEPLHDLCLTREKISWGIPFPLDKNFITAIWTDALINYLTTVNYPNKKYNEFWPALHVIGSDIIWHHSVIWGTWLLASNIKLPNILIHGFIRSSSGEKMSKSLGNVIDPLELVKKYHPDVIRYYLMRSISFGQDGDFSEEALIKRNNAELADSLGNLLNRVVSMCDRYCDSKIPKAKEDKTLSSKLDFKKIDSYIENYELHNALNDIFHFVDECNKYINEKEPWNLAKNNKNEELQSVLFNTAESLRVISQLIYPFMPESSLKIEEQLGFKHRDEFDLKWGNAKSKGIKKGDNLFKKI